jgi:hypothetical protein
MIILYLPLICTIIALMFVFIMEFILTVTETIRSRKDNNAGNF